MRLSREDYTRVRSDSDQFAVLPGPELYWAERTVEERDGWVVVAKIGAGRAVAEILDAES